MFWMAEFLTELWSFTIESARDRGRDMQEWMEYMFGAGSYDDGLRWHEAPWWGEEQSIDCGPCLPGSVADLYLTFRDRHHSGVGYLDIPAPQLTLF